MIAAAFSPGQAERRSAHPGSFASPRGRNVRMKPFADGHAMGHDFPFCGTRATIRVGHATNTIGRKLPYK
jgi:hypothetical protein